MNFSKTLVVLMLAVIATVGCGGNGNSNANAGSSNSSNSQTPLQGSWEVVVSDSSGVNVNYIELNLQQSGSTISATAPTQLAQFELSSGNLDCVGTNCIPYYTSLSATITGGTISGSMAVPQISSFLTFTGAVSNNNSISGTWSDQDSGSGTFVATKVSALSGTYAGTLTFTDNTLNNVTVSVSETANGTVSVSGSVTGPDAGAISLSGYAVGEAVAVQGTTSGQASSVYAWYHGGVVYIVDQNTGFFYGTLSAAQ